MTVCQASPSAEILVGCWGQKGPGTEKPIPTIFKSCHDVIKNKIVVDPKMAMVPQTFSRTPGKGFTLPFHWRSGNCDIQIDTHTAHDEDVFRFLDIAFQAHLINANCVAPPPHWGGTSFVGPKRLINVTIAGSPFRDPSGLAIGSTIVNASVAEF